MILRGFLLLLSIIILCGSVALAYVFVIEPLLYPRDVEFFSFDIFGIISLSVFGVLALSIIAFSYRFYGFITQKEFHFHSKTYWVFIILFGFFGVTLNYINYFVNIKDNNLVECDFHTQGHKDWLLKKYSKTIKGCEVK